MMQISRVNVNFEREELVQPFGFKGGYLTELWQTIALMENGGIVGVGLGTQSVLWSDREVFRRYSQSGGNSLMLLMTEYGLRLAAETWEEPMELLEKLYPAVLDYGRKLTGMKELRPTFALNALVAVDNAAWLVYAAEKKFESFDRMIPEECRAALAERQPRLGQIPLISYGVSLDPIERLVDGGCFFLKIKIGSDPAGDGDRDKMLEWDTHRLTEIHQRIGGRETDHTALGRVAYYLDANGRYDSRERLMRLLDHAEHIGALERILILEEPFDEHAQIDVRDVPVRVAADESAHTDADAKTRIEMGYGAIALKPIAKTLSMSLKIARMCRERRIPCFCADLTVNPILVDWNKNVAARLPHLPGLKAGVIESNGHQNYRRWEALNRYHPCYPAGWIEPINGFYELNESFYEKSGGIFLKPEHYTELVQ
jgi:hypothetical protein